MEFLTITITPEHTAQRLDKTLARHATSLSRARLQALIAEGRVSHNNQPVDNPALKVKAGEIYEIYIPPAIEAIPQAQAIALDIVYEDDDLLVINKPAGMVVHPAAGNHDGTLVNALLAHCGTSLSGIGGVKRPGIVHRLDKETSGLMVAAKNDQAHHGLSEQLAARSLKRVYQAIVWGRPNPKSGLIETKIGRSRTDRQKMAVLPGGGKDSATDYDTLESFGLLASLVECRLRTGRTHQIRVHMGHIGNWMVGDPVYGSPSARKFLKLQKAEAGIASALLDFPRQALHAARLEFIHPISQIKVELAADMPEDMGRLLAILRKKP